MKNEERSRKFRVYTPRLNSRFTNLQLSQRDDGTVDIVIVDDAGEPPCHGRAIIGAFRPEGLKLYPLDPFFDLPCGEDRRIKLIQDD